MAVKSTKKKSAGKKSTAKKNTTKKAAGKKSTAKKNTTKKKSAGKKSTAKKNTTKKATQAKKSPAKPLPPETPRYCLEVVNGEYCNGVVVKSGIVHNKNSECYCTKCGRYYFKYTGRPKEPRKGHLPISRLSGRHSVSKNFQLK